MKYSLTDAILPLCIVYNVAVCCSAPDSDLFGSTELRSPQAGGSVSVATDADPSPGGAGAGGSIADRGGRGGGSSGPVGGESSSSGGTAVFAGGVPNTGGTASGGTGSQARCGDWVTDDTEACDDGPYNGQYDYCSSDCSGPGAYCGDGIVNNGREVCDDGRPHLGPCEDDCTGCKPSWLLNGSVCEAHCVDGRVNGDETDIDCGGSVCGTCKFGRGCNIWSDCMTGVCRAGRCEECDSTSECTNGPSGTGHHSCQTIGQVRCCNTAVGQCTCPTFGCQE